MTVWSIPQLASIWVSNGGNRLSVIDAVSVSLAESGGNDHAVSPSSDYGLWQINSGNFASQGLNGSNWADPNVNARVAIRMSGNGTNWAPWCTAWADPAANCGHGWLPSPQNGSMAGNRIAQVAAVLGGSGISATPVAAAPVYNETWPPFDPNPVSNAMTSWSAVTNFMANGARVRWGQLDYYDQGTRRMTR